MSTHDTGGTALDFNAQELLCGYKFRNGVKVYCCYGMYCDAGHSGDCVGRGLTQADVDRWAMKPAGSAGIGGVKPNGEQHGL